jgi:tRNA 2-thiouridine synthesizing protein E
LSGSWGGIDPMLPDDAFDRDGFLRKLSDWSPAVAAQIASREGLELNREHWEVIELLRAYYDEFDASPAMRPLVKYCALKLGPDKGKSIYLMTLFPGSPAKVGSKIAGLPKPENCL